MKQLSKNGIVRALVLAVVGLWFAVAPHSVYGTFKLVLVVALLAMAVPALVAAFKGRGQQPNFALWRGVGFLIAALLVGVLLKPVIGLLPFAFGLMLILYGVNTVASAKATQTYVNVAVWPRRLYGVIVVIAGVLLVFNPFHTVMLMVQVGGVTLIAMAVVELIASLKAK